MKVQYLLFPVLESAHADTGESVVIARTVVFGMNNYVFDVIVKLCGICHN